MNRVSHSECAVKFINRVGADEWPGCIHSCLLQRRMDLGELETTVRDLSQILWLSPVVVAEVLRLAREAER